MEKLKSINKYVTFSLGETVFGIEVLKTREIVDYNKITPVPEAPPYVKGVINLRGAVVPVVDLNDKFFQTPAQVIESTCIMITEPIIDNEETLMGLVVDSVHDVLEIKEEAFEESPKYGSKLKSEFIHKVASIDQQFIMILDINKVLSQVEINQNLMQQIKKISSKKNQEK